MTPSERLDCSPCGCEQNKLVGEKVCKQCREKSQNPKKKVNPNKLNPCTIILVFPDGEAISGKGTWVSHKVEDTAVVIATLPINMKNNGRKR